MGDKSTRARLFAKLTRKPNGCLEWTGGKDRSGYGAIRIDGRQTGTHRLAWVLENGPIPAGMYVCHHCDNPACCDLDHLFLGTPTDNARDRDRKGRAASWNGSKTHCPRGHEYVPDNTISYGPGNKWRRCYTCDRARRAPEGVAA